MKVKVIAGIIGGSVAILALFLIHTYFPIIMLAGFCGIAAYELLKSLSVKSKSLIAYAVTIATLVPFGVSLIGDEILTRPEVLRFAPLALMVFLLSFFFIMLSKLKKITWTHIFVAMASSTLIPLALSSFVFIRDFVPVVDSVSKETTAQWPIFWLLFGLACCWITDSGAYLIGMATGGKHKMAPTVSPNKSWEGAVGGVVINVIFNIGVWFLFEKCGWFGDLTPPLWLIPVIAPMLSVLGILGDLTFSAVKRQTGIKDFGNLIPGHGGALDRFDSYMFVMPTLWAILWVIYR